MVNFISQIIVLVFGIIMLVLSGWGILAPNKLMTLVTATMDRDWGIYVAVGVRLVLGAALIGAASGSNFPAAFHVIGWIAIISAVVVAAIGRKRLRDFIGWWSERFSAPILRLWMLFGLAFGVFLVYGVL